MIQINFPNIEYMSAKRDNPDLWERIKNKWLKSDKGGEPNKWNARKAQLSTKEYQDKGGGYIGPKKKDNSLTKWTKEKWNYIDTSKKSGRYLPKKVRERLTDREKIRENKLKGKKKGENIRYSESVKRKMRALNIF